MQAGLRVYQACEVLAVHRSYVGDAKLDKMLSWHTKRWALRERGYDCFGSLARPALADATAAFSFDFRVHNRLLFFADPLIFAGVYFNYPTDRNSIAASTFIAVTEKIKQLRPRRSIVIGVSLLDCIVFLGGGIACPPVAFFSSFKHVRLGINNFGGCVAPIVRG
jgi:hypothetical protein